MNQKISVKDALKGKQVLITGTTGFVGKALVEKLLRAVPDIGGIYLLIRGSRKHKDARERFDDEIATSSIFNHLKDHHGDTGFGALCQAKVHCVTGEITEPRFGLSESEFVQLADKIDIVINSAASVNFREALGQALTINTLCLLNILEFVQAAGEVPLVQVSTCYVNGYRRGVIEERVYGPTGEDVPRHPAGYYEVESLIETLQQRVAQLEAAYDNEQARENALVDEGIAVANAYGWNDTYTFTKWLGEQLLMKHRQGKALTIVRPAIVESAWSEPEPGWLEGVKVADAIILAYAREKVTFFPGNPKAVLDVIPVDMVANSIIISAAEMLCKPSAHRIYQCASSVRNPLTIETLKHYVVEAGRHHYRQYPNLFYRQPKRPFMMVSPALFKRVMNGLKFSIDTVRKLAGWLSWDIQHKSLSNFETTLNLATVFSFYSSPTYTFSAKALCALSSQLVEAERAEFVVDAADLDWHHYLGQVHLHGLDTFALRPRRLYGEKPVGEKARKAA